MITFIVYCRAVVNKKDYYVTPLLCYSNTAIAKSTVMYCNSTICAYYKEHLQLSTTWLSRGIVGSNSQSILRLSVSVPLFLYSETESTPRNEPDGKWSFTAHASTYLTYNPLQLELIKMHGFLHCILGMLHTLCLSVAFPSLLRAYCPYYLPVILL